MMDLRRVFLGLQERMIATLEVQRETIDHRSTKGTATELQWLAMLEGYLPQRYCATSAFVIDGYGQISDQIDIVIYDRHYSPFLLHEGNAVYIPAESVYAVLEVKQRIQGHEIAYAGAKGASVRRLRRTSAAIPHAGGLFPPKDPPRILAGLLALESGLKPPMGEGFQQAICALPEESRLDLGCVLRDGAFSVDCASGQPKVELRPRATALIYFFLKLLSRLQAVGTVAAMDYDQYGQVL